MKNNSLLKLLMFVVLVLLVSCKTATTTPMGCNCTLQAFDIEVLGNKVLYFNYVHGSLENCPAPQCMGGGDAPATEFELYDADGKRVASPQDKPLDPNKMGGIGKTGGEQNIGIDLGIRIRNPTSGSFILKCAGNCGCNKQSKKYNWVVPS